MRPIGALLTVWLGFSICPAVELFGPARVTVAVGDTPDHIAVGEFNGDGVPDLAVVSRTDDTVTILLSQGLPGFVRSSDIVVGERPSWTAVGDFNADGAADLAVANQDAATVSILFGDGLGTFVRDMDIPVGTFGSFNGAVAVGDFNQDGVADVVTSSGAVLLADGLGGFTRAPDLARTGFVVVGEFNGDGVEDIGVADPDGNSMNIFLGESRGDFVLAEEFDLGAFFPWWEVVVGDFNGDSVADLVVTVAVESLQVLLGDGLGGLRPGPSVDVGDTVASLAVGEFNGDTVTDLAVTFSGGGTLLLGQGSGQFARATDIQAPFPGFVTVGEFNGDGATDLVVTDILFDTVSVLLGDGLGGLAAAPSFDALSIDPVSGNQGLDGVFSVAVGDFNADGADDVVVSSGVVLLGDGLGGFSRAPDLGVSGFAVAVGEFNGDGVADVAVLVVDEGVTVFLGDNLGGFVRVSDVEVGGTPWAVVVGEFDGDGITDLAVANQGLAPDYEGHVNVLLGDGSGGFQRFMDAEAGGSSTFVALGRLNDDDHDDLVVTNLADKSVSALLGDGNGGFLTTGHFEVGPRPLAVVVGEFSGDGVVDLAVVGGLVSAEGWLNILLGDGEGGFTRAKDMVLGVGPRFVTAEDFNRDGALDLAVAHRRPDFVGILLGDGRGGFDPPIGLGGGGFPFSLAAGEFDDDGEIDLVVANQRGNTVSLLFNRLLDRADVNGSNRIDGFDIAQVGRSMGRVRDDPGFRRDGDPDLNGLIDGDDLALVAARFGELRKKASPLRPALQNPLSADPDTITLQPVASEGDLLTVEVRVNDTDAPTSAADFALTFEPSDNDLAHVLEFAGFDPGNYLAGGTGQAYNLDTGIPGRVGVSVTRLPSGDQLGSGEQAVMRLLLRAKREGEARLDFGPFRQAEPVLLNMANEIVPGVSFVGGVTVDVSAVGGGPPGQRIGFAPDELAFGKVPVGASSRRTLRISNFGFGELDVYGVTSTLPEFESFFTSPFAVPPFGFVELVVEFSSARLGLFSGDLVIESSDPLRPDTDANGRGEARVPLSGVSGLAVAAIPNRLDFGTTAVGSEKTAGVRLTNRGTTPLTLTSVHSTDQRFIPHASFSFLDPGETGQLEVRFRPVSIDEIHGMLILGFDAPLDKTVVLSLSGSGDNEGSDGGVLPAP